VIIVSLTSSTQETAAMHYTITSIALLLLSGSVVFENEGLMYPRGLPAGMKELNVAVPFRYPFSIAVIDQYLDADFDVLDTCIRLAEVAIAELPEGGLGLVGGDNGEEAWTPPSMLPEEICAPRLPGSFLLEWIFCIDAGQKTFFWAMAIVSFVVLHAAVLMVATLSVVERRRQWLSYVGSNGVSWLWNKRV
jgi:hypothetical protein